MQDIKVFQASRRDSETEGRIQTQKNPASNLTIVQEGGGNKLNQGVNPVL